MLFINNSQSTEFAVTMSIAGGLVLISVVIIAITIIVQREKTLEKQLSEK